jgi:hypothetical protein
MSDNTNTQTTTLDLKTVARRDFDYRAAVATVRKANEAVRATHGEVMWNAAVILSEVKRRDLIGPKAGAAGWPTQVAYATDAGYAESTGSLLATLARSIDKGVKHGSPEWSYLVQNGTKGTVSKGVKDAKNLTGIRAAIREAKAEADKPKGKATGANWVAVRKIMRDEIQSEDGRRQKMAAKAQREASQQAVSA